MSGPTTDDGGPWSFDSLMNSSDEEDETDMPDNKMTVITVEVALFAADQAASGELDAETAAEIDKLFKANSVLGGKESDNCIALAKQVGVQPNRLYTEFNKRRAASGTKRAPSGEPDAETAAEIDKLFKANSVLGSVKSDNCIALAKQVGCTPWRLSAEFQKRRAASGTKRVAASELDAETAAEIDKLFKANSVLGDVKSDNCIALAKQVGCTPARLLTEFNKRRAAAGTKRAPSGEPDAETAAEIDKLFKANSVLGKAKSDNCIALAKQVGCTPARLITEFKKRRAASGTKRASGKRAGVGKSGKKKAAVQKTIKKKSPPKKKPLAPCTANKPAPMGPPQLPPEPMSPPPGWA